MRVELTRRAERDLDEISDWIAGENQRRAASFVRELRDSCLGLSDNPHRFQLIDRRPHGDVRRRVHGAYLIFYRVEVAQVTILRVLHGARDYEPLLFPDDPPV